MAQLREYENLGREIACERWAKFSAKLSSWLNAGNGDMPEMDTPANAETLPKASSLPPLGEAAEQLVEKLKVIREIAPRYATELWQVSRTTAYRRLTKLERAGWLEKHGSTTAIRYQLTPQGSANL